MSNIVILMRHAKSSWDDDSLSDFERPLNERGLSASSKMAQFLLKNDWIPNQVISSSSKRTRETADLLMAGWQRKVAATFLDELYLAPAITLAKNIVTHWCPGTLLVLAHNPGMEVICSNLVGESLHMPTAALCVFRWTGTEAPKSHDQINWQNFRLLKHAAPKLLED